jgi:hypothetical protein
MNVHAGYAQARIQAHYAALPTESLWLHLGALNELASFLEAARSTSIAAWVSPLSAFNTASEIEHALRRTLNETIIKTASWYEPRWQPAFLWLETLSELPDLECLLRNDLAPEGRLNERLLTQMSEMSSETDDLLQTWVAIWRSNWPNESSRNVQGIETLLNLLEDHWSVFPTLAVDQAWSARHDLELRLRLLFRRHVLQPAMAFSYLSLVALGLERLRSELMQRALFDGQEEDSP